MKIVFDATLEGLSTRADKSIKIILGTQEMSSDEAGKLLDFRNEFVKVMMSNTNISKLEEELVDATPIGNLKKNKTHSQRLRACLFRLHEQLPDESVDFETFYSRWMEGFIDSIKSKLN